LKRTTFPYSNTEGPEVEWPELPEWDWQDALAALDIEQVPFQMIDGNTQGYSFDRKVAVSPVAVYPVKTAFHELAHVMLGHTTAAAPADGEALCRGVREFQAEAVAYGKALGQPPTRPRMEACCPPRVGSETAGVAGPYPDRRWGWDMSGYGCDSCANPDCGGGRPKLDAGGTDPFASASRRSSSAMRFSGSSWSTRK
jgi:hypothetical protein